MKRDSLQTLNLIAQTLYNKKGFNLLALDVRGMSTLTDYFLIAEGNVDKHVSSLAQSVIEALKKINEIPIHVEGLSQGDWIGIDYLDIVVHLFMPAMRDKYRLEELWHMGKIVHLDLVIPGKKSGSKK